jgi:hypothetical protein
LIGPSASGACPGLLLLGKKRIDRKTKGLDLLRRHAVFAQHLAVASLGTQNQSLGARNHEELTEMESVTTVMKRNGRSEWSR